jgi:putative oxidoreductase
MRFPQSALRVMMLIDTKGDPGNHARMVMWFMDSVVAAIRWLARPSLTQLFLRIALAMPFWDSGILKWNHFLQLNSETVYSFANDVKFYLPGGPYNLPAPGTMALLFGCGEIIFPILLVFGLGTRFAATGLLLIAYVVELTAPGDWPMELTWFAMALGVMAWGPGRLSFDHALRLALTRAAKADGAT